MADSKITALTAGTVISSGDPFVYVDISDTSMDAGGTTKKIDIDVIVTYLNSTLAFAGDVLTTKGDVYTFDSDNQRLAVGSNDQVLTVDLTEPTGLKWATPASGVAANTDLFLPASNGTSFEDSLLRQEASTSAENLISDAINHIFAITGDGVDADAIKLVSEYDATNSYGLLTFDGLTGGLLTLVDDKDNELFTASDVSGNPIMYCDADWLVEFGNPFNRPFSMVYDSGTGDTDMFLNAIRYNVLQLVDYADDTAAGVGGLVTGDLYRTTATKAIAVKD